MPISGLSLSWRIFEKIFFSPHPEVYETEEDKKFLPSLQLIAGTRDKLLRYHPA